MVDKHDRDVMVALQVAQIGEQRGDLAADVFVDAVEPDERVEDEQARLQPENRFFEAAAVGVKVEAEAGGGDDLDIEIGEVETGGARCAARPPRRRAGRGRDWTR